MHAVLDRPVPADEGGELVGVGLVGCQVRNAVHDFFAGALSVQSAGVADDPEDLRGAGEDDAGGGHDVQQAVFGAAVTPFALPGAGRLLVGQPVDDRGSQRRLVAFDGHHVAGAGVVEQRGGGVLGVQGVQGEHHGRGAVPGGA